MNECRTNSFKAFEIAVITSSGAINIHGGSKVLESPWRKFNSNDIIKHLTNNAVFDVQIESRSTNEYNIICR